MFKKLIKTQSDNDRYVYSYLIILTNSDKINKILIYKKLSFIIFNHS